MSKERYTEQDQLLLARWFHEEDQQVLVREAIAARGSSFDGTYDAVRDALLWRVQFLLPDAHNDSVQMACETLLEEALEDFGHG